MYRWEGGTELVVNEWRGSLSLLVEKAQTGWLKAHRMEDVWYSKQYVLAFPFSMA
jgi:hypothetical protein